MAHRTILTERQRSALFDLPTDETAMLRHYTLADDDLEIIRARRRRGDVPTNVEIGPGQRCCGHG